ncbi:DinB family protein [Spirosoma harenae]
MQTTTEPTIKQRLLSDCQAFIDLANVLSEDQFRANTSDKWSVAEVMQHLYLSARPVARLMTGPREVMIQWGRVESPTQNYNEVALTYQNVLGKGLKAPAMASPRPEDMAVEKQVIIDRFIGVYQALDDAINSWSEEELDEYSMPHPALGKLSVRQMLFFTSIHTQHHFRLLPAYK